MGTESPFPVIPLRIQLCWIPKNLGLEYLTKSVTCPNTTKNQPASFKWSTITSH